MFLNVDDDSSGTEFKDVEERRVGERRQIGSD